jgi:hypothetical protein
LQLREFQDKAQAAKQAQLDRFEQQRAMAALVASNRQEPLVSVMGNDGNPVLVPRSQAANMRPWDQKSAAQQSQKKQSEISTQQVLDQAAELDAHPGRLAATGGSSWLSNIPGTDAKGFQANLDTFKAQTFIPMVSALKGMGALSDAEGKKLSESIGALDPKMPESEFRTSLAKVTRTLYEKAKAGGLNVSLPDFAVKIAETKQSPSSGTQSGNIVVDPNGVTHTFPTAQAAAQFKKAAGL